MAKLITSLFFIELANLTEAINRVTIYTLFKKREVLHECEQKRKYRVRY